MTALRALAAALLCVLAAARPSPAADGDLVFEAALESPRVAFGDDVVLRLAVTNRSAGDVEVPVFRLAQDSVSVRVAWGGEQRATVTRLWGQWAEEGAEVRLRPTPTQTRVLAPGERLTGSVAFAAVVPGDLSLTVVWGAEGPQRRTSPALAVEVPRGSAARRLVAQFDTSLGTFGAELDGAVAFNSVSHFWRLVRDGFHRELGFHRVEPGLFAQGGCPRGDGTGGTGWHLPAEGDGRAPTRGTLGLARGAHPDSASCQFLVVADVEGTAKTLTAEFTPLGRVVEGQEDVVDTLSRVAVDPKSLRPRTPVVISAVRALVK